MINDRFIMESLSIGIVYLEMGDLEKGENGAWGSYILEKKNKIERKMGEELLNKRGEWVVLGLGSNLQNSIRFCKANGRVRN